MELGYDNMNYFRTNHVDREVRITHHVIRDVWRNELHCPYSINQTELLNYARHDLSVFDDASMYHILADSIRRSAGIDTDKLLAI